MYQISDPISVQEVLIAIPALLFFVTGLWLVLNLAANLNDDCGQRTK